ncbi:hypothetical protein N431DRAFT_516423, partial [Stipitochalara longipes BDJ]
ILGKLARPIPRGVVVFVLVLEDIAGGVPTFTFLPLSSPPSPNKPFPSSSTSRSPMEKSRSFSSSLSESSSSSVAKGLRFFRCCSPLSPFSPLVAVESDWFCFECSASRAANCLRAREGGMFKGGGGGGGAEGGSRSEVELVATVVEGVEM